MRRQGIGIGAAFFGAILFVGIFQTPASAARSGYIVSCSPSSFSGSARTVTVRVRNTGDSGYVIVEWDSKPSGWSISPSYRNPYVSSGSYYNATFTVTPPSYDSSGTIKWEMYFDRQFPWPNELLDTEYQFVTNSTPETVTTPNTPSGPSSGETGQSLLFSTGGSTSNKGHSLQYRFDWGDGSYSSWGSSSRSHSYSSPGTKYVRAQARCAMHTSVTSSWSGSRSVSILRTKSGDILSADPDSFSGGQTRTVTVVVKNTGRDDNNLIVECDSKPSGWSVSPGSKQTNVPYNTTNSTFFTFSVTAPSYDSSGTIVWKLYYDDTWPTPNTLLDTYNQGVSSTVPETITTPSTPSGPSDGLTGESLAYSTSATNNKGHSLQYRFDWGDGTTSSWGSSSQSHSYSSPGTFSVKAQARCATHTTVTSAWSNGKSVTIQRPKAGQIVSLTPNPIAIVGGQTVTVTVGVKNTGRDDANMIVECDSKPSGWSVSPGSKQTNVPYNTTNSTYFTFSVTAPNADSSGTIVWKLYYDDFGLPNTLLDTVSQSVMNTPEEHEIAGFPDYGDYNVSHPLSPGGICGSTAAAAILAYYDKSAYGGVQYWNLLDNGQAGLTGEKGVPGRKVLGNVPELVETLVQEMHYGDDGWEFWDKLFCDQHDRDGITRVCNDPAFKNCLAFVANLDDLYHPYETLKDEIKAGRPIMYGVDLHWLPAYGFRHTAQVRWVKAKLNVGYLANVEFNFDTWNDYGDLDCYIRIMPGGVPGDGYESDDVSGQATIIDSGDDYNWRQEHNFHAASDHDWVTFAAKAGHRYTLRTENLASAASTRMYAYAAGDLSNAVASDADGGAAVVVVDGISDSAYYVHVTNANTQSGPLTRYDLTIEEVPLPQVQMSGHVRTSGGTGIGGVAMSGLPGTPSTDGSGYYSATASYGWTGTVTPGKTGYTFTPGSRSYSSITSDQVNQDYTGALMTYTVSGYVRTGSGTGVAGVVLNGLPGSPITDGTGYYSATVSHGWSGTVTPAKVGYTFAPSSRDYSNVTSNQSGQDYTASLQTCVISGHVRTSTGSGIGGVVMSGLPGAPTTDGSGSYNASASYGWSGTVTPAKSGYTFTPPNRAYNNVTTDQPNQDYAGNVPPQVNITSPANGAIVARGSNLVVTATASDNGGVVTKVEFFHGGVKFGEDTSGPYEATWINIPLGTHTLTAKATDDDGAMKVSDPVTVEVRTPGDTNGDGKVDPTDLANLLDNWNPLGTGASFEDGDFNGDGKVDPTDLAILLDHWDPVGKDVVAPVEVRQGAGDSPRLIATDPVLGSQPADLKTLSLTFDRPVEVGANVVEVYGLETGAHQDFTVTYDAATRTLRLVWPEPLPPDTYEVRIWADAILGAGGGAQLDGEVGDPTDPDSLPSGDGRPGGDARLEFEVE